MKSRSLGIIFVAAVIVPSILLAVLAIRSAGREEAFIERQLASALDADVTHTAALALSEVNAVAEELAAGVDVPAGADYARILSAWKKSQPLVSVPFLLSPGYRILWPSETARLDADQKRFLQENGDFLNDKAATTVLQNIAVRYQAEILAETARTQTDARELSTTSASGATVAAAPSPGASGTASLATPTAPAGKARAAEAQPTALAEESQAADRGVPAAGGALDAAPAEQAAPVAAPSAAPSAARQTAIDAFAQSADIQNKVYELAREKGDKVSPRNVQPTVDLAQSSGVPTQGQGFGNANAVSGAVAAAPADDESNAAADSLRNKDTAVSETPAATSALKVAAAPDVKQAPAEVRKEAVQTAAPSSQYVITSQLLSEIASTTDRGLIPRFIGEKLVFLFWERQKDGRIAGCELASDSFRARISSVLTATWTPQRILTLLDENGAPLASPPDVKALDWHRPFVSEPIGESLPRWEAAAYLTTPQSITNQARTSSIVIWILVLILFVSVAGGGTMVLSSVYGEMRLAQKKATFVTNVSHELKTPLTSISLFVELLRGKRPIAQAKREQYLSLMASETERLTRLINNVLDFSSLDRGVKRYTLRTLDAAGVAEDVVESQRVRLESRGFTVTFHSHSSGLRVRADPEAVKQVLLNLLANAEKYSADRKEIGVEVDAGPEGAVRMHVLDRGIGIADKDREKIFREFYRVNDSLASGVQGTGLGLTIARRIARDLGGDVSCAPRDGGGSDFIVSLPGAQTAEEDA